MDALDNEPVVTLLTQIKRLAAADSHSYSARFKMVTLICLSCDQIKSTFWPLCLVPHGRVMITYLT